MLTFQHEPGCKIHEVNEEIGTFVILSYMQLNVSSKLLSERKRTTKFLFRNRLTCFGIVCNIVIQIRTEMVRFPIIPNFWWVARRTLLKRKGTAFSWTNRLSNFDFFLWLSLMKPAQLLLLNEC